MTTSDPTLRIPALSGNESPETVELTARIKAERGGRLLMLYRVLLNSPPLAAGWLHLLTAVRQQTLLPPVLRELIILHIAILNGAYYEFDMHAPLARAAGVSDAILQQLRGGSVPEGLAASECAALKLAGEMTRDVAVRDETFAAVRMQFDDRSILELTVTIAAYNMVSRVLRALNIEAEPR